MMSTTILLVAGAVGAVVSWWLTGRMRRYALRARLLDHPNERSSHSVPTPRGGGVAIVASYLALVAGLMVTGRVDRGLALTLITSGSLVATIGYWDDRYTLPARWRFLVQTIAAGVVLCGLGNLPDLPALGTTIKLGMAAELLAGLYLLWSINLFNFMDGIDGIASLEAITISLGGALVWWIVQPEGAWPLAVLFAACVAGFLRWNFPPARIFMGDAGSGFLGLVIAVLALWSSRSVPPLFWSWLILGGCFIADATTTLVRRVRRGERFYEAHRSHAYQYAARRHGSHRIVTLAYAAITTFWLLPLSVVAATAGLDGLVCAAIAYAPLLWLAFRYKAGARAQQEL